MENDYEMPTPCQKCGNIFDLNDGTGSEKWFPNTVICEPCGEIEQKEIENDEQIDEQKLFVENAIFDLKNCGKQLSELHGLNLLSEEDRKLVLHVINED